MRDIDIYLIKDSDCFQWTDEAFNVEFRSTVLESHFQLVC